MKIARVPVVAFLFACGVATIFGQPARQEHYALILTDVPVARIAGSRGGMHTAAAVNHRRSIEGAQAVLRQELGNRKIRVTGAAKTVLNAVFVAASSDREAELRALPGVKAVIRMRRVRPKLNKAVGLLNAPAAWSALGGAQNAGKGVKIGIIDTGIDQTHPAFNPAGFTLPPGFPPVGSDPNYTTNKVIVARSYVVPSLPIDPTQSYPDDTSPRDHIGHGTAVAMAAAGETNAGPSATITGMAPQAWLGNYKVFGSTYNLFTTIDMIIEAIDDAVNDGMDVINLSLGGPSFSGPLDSDVCNNPPGEPCDPETTAIQNAVNAGVTVVAVAGNEGEDGVDASGNSVITHNTIDSPAYVPEAIAVGASTNSHQFINELVIPGSDVPSGLQRIQGVFGDGPLPAAPLTAPMVDVGKIGDPLGCDGLPSGSLNRAIALVQRGTCLFIVKINNLQTAGAVGAIIINNPQDDSLFVAGGLAGTRIPAIAIGYSDGQNLKSFVSSNRNHAGTLDPTLHEAGIGGANAVADFSSRGPVTGSGAIKPELLATGTELYLATERTDPTGDLYNASGYTVSQGTSFASPLVAGAAALVKQKNPQLTPGQVKSALVNTASQAATENSGPAQIVSAGAGLLDVNAALGANVTAEPATLSFGILGSGTGRGPAAFPAALTLKITNTGGGPVNLSYSAARREADSKASVTLDHSTATLAGGQADTLRVSLGGSFPSAGSYSGMVTIQGGTVPLRIPWLYLVGDGVPATIIPVLGWGEDGTVNQPPPDGAVVFKLIDQYGVPAPNVPVSFAATSGGGRITKPDAQTDSYGFAGATATYGPQPGDQEFVGQAGGLTVYFDDTARAVPVINAGGAVNAADYQAGNGVAPGSYIALFGTALSDATAVATTTELPTSLQGALVTFDAPSGAVSVPGRMYYASPGQINVQVPWELSGQTLAVIKVNIGETTGQIYNLPLATYSPAFFQYPASNTQFVAAVDLAGKLISATNPAIRGNVVALYANGLGPVTNQPASGAPAPASPLSETTTMPIVTIGGVQAPVQFSGLNPGFAGLYQLNVTIPANVPAGIQPVTVSIGGVTSPASSLPVQ